MRTEIATSLLTTSSHADKVNYYLLFLMQQDAEFMVNLRDLQVTCKSTCGIEAIEVEKILAKWISEGSIRQVVIGSSAYVMLND